MRVSDFDFVLPESLIALRPARPRRAARLLAARGAAPGDPLDDRAVEDLPRLLAPGDLLVLNDTRVIPARLRGERRRETSDGSGVARIETTLAARAAPDVWRALARPARRLRPGDSLAFVPWEEDCGAGAPALSATILSLDGGEATLRFDRSGPDLDAAVAVIGAPPLPPYIESRRQPDARDRADYQTVFARRDGSVAAPTAALHFDAEVLAALKARGVLTASVTLHVGPGTFLPVRADNVLDHRMHAEWGEISPEAAAAINAARAAGGRVIAVGTTALRLLESAAEQDGRVAPWRGETDIFITPGYQLRAVDGLMTNFHLPRSTLFMLVCALMGAARMQEVYAHAIASGYRFYSYGDSSLLLPRG
ncbi:tRNA preQ1(34) S-adenosylmethionine ribosyltransferase-isomerase QueA [Rubrimonas cliftonensis]|uniref:S-adenosylmethionine:tRNA ribosyltransferase-isomerase n=1 Tax=Rubrimonas cliftonensis TaxID=89524 RepID=A0A1H3X3I1_9RHOB|nr:tRNA preQ1(34) S-adenosylmethionine ribosyltransferase-isomerase QueA [Rubrimonas cliftonensis]SDZ93947.1 S-adenosylmethionine:tRNA ribosyltransferase-isomerase [Rubrimonas cliftonensis]